MSEMDSAAIISPNPVAALDTFIDRLKKTEPSIRAWEHLDIANARETAERLAKAPDRENPLWGRIVGVKDVIDVAGMPTKAGSRALDGVIPAVKDSTVVARLRQAGCIILGKLKTTEFAYTDACDTANPVNPLHTPGGSSSGSAAAIAAGSADLTLGTQTVGSVCRPAAYCGVAAFKPSTGSTALTGVIQLARSFDTVGFFANDIKLAIAAFHSCSAQAVLRTHPPAWKELRVGFIADSFYDDCAPSVQLPLEQLRQRLATLEVTISDIRTGCDHQAIRDDQRVLMFREAAAVHGNLLDTPALLKPNWRAALEQGMRITQSQYLEARDRLTDARHRLSHAIEDVDYLIVPPVRDTAPIGLHATGDAGLIVSWTVHGGPLAVLQVAQSANGLPIAAMIVGKPWTDRQTGAFAAALQACISSMPLTHQQH